MKPLRVLSPIEKDEHCWVKVAGVWWLVRAEEGIGCSACCLGAIDYGCSGIACNGHPFTRVHPIPMPDDERDIVLGNIYEGEARGFRGDVWLAVTGGYTRIGPPEE